LIGILLVRGGQRGTDTKEGEAENEIAVQLSEGGPRGCGGVKIPREGELGMWEASTTTSPVKRAQETPGGGHGRGRGRGGSQEGGRPYQV
jgi:hypothetical protein